MITKLTPEQEAELPRFRQRYLDIACGGGRIDRPELESALADAYAVIGKPAPKLFIFDSPAACMLALKIFKMPEESQLGSQLGSQLRSQLWSQIGSQLRSQIESQLWSQKIYDGNYLWGSQDIYWLAWGRFVANIGVKLEPETLRNLDIMERISTQCEWWWPYEGIVIASQRPTAVRWDDENRLHCENGPAVEYADGYGLSSWHGQAIPGVWVTGNPPKASEALHWSNMDQRAAACEIVGWANILDELDAKVIDDSGDHIWGRLVEVDLPDSGRERFLDAMCGTGRRFSLPVPPSTASVDEAQSVLHGGLPVEILRNYEVRT